MKLKHVVDGNGAHYGYRFECPGCKAPHIIPTLPAANGWYFTGDEEGPTFSPSILVHPHGALADDGSVYQTPLCHSYVRDGQIQFLFDCTHALAGQTVDLPDLTP